MCRRLWHTPKISRKFAGEWRFGLWCYGRDESRPGYRPALVRLFRGIFFQGTWHILFQGGSGEFFPCSWCFRSCLLFLSVAMITLICQLFGALPEQATWHTQASQTAPCRFKALSISGWISSQPAAFPAFRVLTARKTLTALMLFCATKRISCVSGGVIVTGFKRSLKYSPDLPRMSSSSLSKTPFSSLMGLEVWDLLQDSLPEYFIDLLVIGILFLSEILPRLHFGPFHRECCGLSYLNLPQIQGRVGWNYAASNESP